VTLDYTNWTDEALEARLSELRQDHADFEAALQALAAAPVPDLMVMGRLKRKKLGIKDEIARIEEYLTPDIIA
jgi:hypothetical protein